jgi:hypothetical protein
MHPTVFFECAKLIDRPASDQSNSIAFFHFRTPFLLAIVAKMCVTMHDRPVGPSATLLGLLGRALLHDMTIWDMVCLLKNSMKSSQ